MRDGNPGRTFVLGLDGIPWSLLSTWVEEGHLPNFARISREGASGPLESTMPPTTALAWPSIATGVGPDKHGIHFFGKLNDDYTTRPYTSNDINSPTIWEMLSPSVVGNVPMTYPAQEIDGTIVSGMMTPRFDERAVHPQEAYEDIRKRIPEYEIGLSWSDYGDEREAFLRDLQSLFESRRELMRYLMEIDDWELFFFVYTEPDRLQHLIWDEEVILDHYEQLDDVLGEILEYIEGTETNLFVVSDHGFGPINKFVCVNSILESNGFLQRMENRNIRKFLDSVGISKKLVENLLKRLQLDEFVYRMLSPSLFARIAEQVPGDSVLHDIDFTQTTAFCYGPGYIYIHDQNRFKNGMVSPPDIEKTKEEIMMELNDFSEKMDDGKLRITDGDDVFPSDKNGPDLIITAIGEYEVKARLSSNPIIDSETEVANHRSEGIVLAWGNEISSTKIRDAKVFDIAPTILHGMGRPVPERTDGRVLDVFDPSSRPGTTEVTQKNYESRGTHREFDEDFSEVEDRLRGLGYVE